MPADRVDGAGRSHHGADAAFEAAQVLFVAPVHADAIRDGRGQRTPALEAAPLLRAGPHRAPRGTAIDAHAAIREQLRFRIEQQLAGHGANRRIGEGFDERLQRIAREHLARIGEDDDLVPRAGGTGIQRDGFAPASKRDDVDCPGILRQHLQRVVGRSVRHDDDLAPSGELEAEQVVEPRRQARPFVACGNHNRDAVLRIAECGLRTSSSPPRPHVQRRRISGVDVGHEPGRQPEHHRRAGHVTAWAGSAGSATRGVAGLGAPSLKTCGWLPAMALRVSTTSRADSTTIR